MESKVKILVFGTNPPCAKCQQAEREARLAAERFPAGQVVVEKHNALSEMGQKYGIAVTPTIIVNDKKVATGKVLTKDELVEIVKKEIGV